MELVGDEWRAIGIRVFTKPSALDVFRNRIFAGQSMMSVWTGFDDGIATADAMPFLERAKTVTVLTISEKKSKRDEPQGADIVDHLGRYCRKVDFQQLVSKDLDVVNALLSYAADAGADFIVMGGYGHSRLREFVLGGVTRGMLTTMTVPTLMSH